MEKNKYLEERIGFSTLGWLDKGPKYYRMMQEAEREEKLYFKFGSALHCKILEPERFLTDYYTSTVNIPTGKYIEAIKVLVNTAEAIEDQEAWYLNAMAAAELKVSIKAFTTKITTPEYEAVYQDLTRAHGKILLGAGERKSIETSFINVTNHKIANELLFDNPLVSTAKVQSFNELEIDWSHESSPLPIRSTLDRVVINHETKTVTIVDIKTTAKGVYSFKYSYKHYGYYRQAAVYKEAMKFYMEK